MGIASFFEKAYRVFVKEKRLPISWVSRYHELMYKAKLDSVLQEFGCLAPFPCSDTAAVELHMLTCTRDLHMAVAAVKSLMLYQPSLKLVFHGDSTIEESHREFLESQFPGCDVILLEEADQRIAMDPRVSKLRAAIADRFSLGAGYERQRAAWALKVFDFYILSSSEKVIVLDSDTLFLKRPPEILSWIDGPSDVAFFSQPSSPNFRLETESFQSSFPNASYIGCFNGGLFGYSKINVTYELVVSVVERILSDPGFPVYGDECVWRVILSHVESLALDFNVYPLITNPDAKTRSSIDELDSNYIHFILKHRGGYYSSVARRLLDRIKKETLK